MNDSVPVWAAIALPALGYIVAVATEFVRAWQSAKMRREERYYSRLRAREDARRAFELETLIELQNVMSSLVRYAARIFHSMELEFRKHGTWGRKPLPDDIGGEVSTALPRDFHRLRVRILNDDLRARVKEWWSLGAEATTPPMRDEIDAEAHQRALSKWVECTGQYIEISELVGSLLRTHFFEQDPS